jgi:uncharacterized membrane protein
MTDLIIATFTQESHAIEASIKMLEHESIGEISIYELVIIKKNQDGNTEILKSENTGESRTLSGLAFGNPADDLAGPVGTVIAMFSGTFTGALLESDYFSLSEDLGSKVIMKLQAGTVALVAEIDENNTVFVNESLEAMGGRVSRIDVDYEYKKYADEQIETYDDEIAKERAKIKIAVIREKDKIQKKIAELKEKRRKRIAKLEGEPKRTKNESKARLQNSGEKAKDSTNELIISRLWSRIRKHQAKIDALRNEIRKIQS